MNPLSGRVPEEISRIPEMGLAAAASLEEILQRKYSRIGRNQRLGLIFPRSFQKTEEHTRWGDEAPRPQGRAASGARAALWCGALVPPPTLPFRLLKLSVAKTLLPRATIRKYFQRRRRSNPISGIQDIASGTLPERGIITGGLYITMPSSGLMYLGSESENASRGRALKKMGELFRAYKNRLWKTYKDEKKPPKFEGYLSKQEHNWEEFLKYKSSEDDVVG
ncbi:hypothetical protein QYE76_023982 [Lolium multiflorum]|uniref:Uncharacterized protein n=1 Tax=Lolium multiflorum TaxID=4521 RepID=A0AAD8RBK8_LOLMU|nr:hypothetical protein QYE76_023982 [Lolium multiflorum]